MVATRLLCLDVDGTLVDRMGRFYQGVSKIYELREAGYFIGISSARPSWALTSVSDVLCGTDFMVAFQGAHVHVGSHPCSTECTGDIKCEIAPSVVKAVCRSLPPSIAIWTYTASCWRVNYMCDAVEAEAVIIGREPDEVGEEIQSNNVLKLLLVCADAGTASSYLTLMKSFAVNAFISHGGYVEVVSKRALRGKGLPWVARSLGVVRRHSVAAGDSENDVEMLRWAGIGFTFESANQRVKNASDIVLKSPQSGGLLDLLNILERGVLDV